MPPVDRVEQRLGGFEVGRVKTLGEPDTRGQPRFRRDFRQKIKKIKLLPGAGRRCTSAASFDCLSPALGARSWPRNRPESGECRLTQFDAAIAFGRGAGLIDRRRSGRVRLIPIILGEVHDFAGDLRAVFAMCITPRLLAAMIIGS
jgi:hypothetical protein